MVKLRRKLHVMLCANCVTDPLIDESTAGVELQAPVILKALLDAGASLMKATSSATPQTAFDIAVASGYQQCAFVLFAAGSIEQKVEMLHACCRCPNKRRGLRYFVRLLQELDKLDQREKFVEVDAHGNTYLHTAAVAGNNYVVKYLLEDATAGAEMLLAMNRKFCCMLECSIAVKLSATGLTTLLAGGCLLWWVLQTTARLR